MLVTGCSSYLMRYVSPPCNHIRYSSLGLSPWYQTAVHSFGKSCGTSHHFVLHVFPWLFSFLGFIVLRVSYLFASICTTFYRSIHFHVQNVKRVFPAFSRIEFLSMFLTSFRVGINMSYTTFFTRNCSFTVCHE